MPTTLNPLNQFLWNVAFVKFSAAPVGVGDTWKFTTPANEMPPYDLRIDTIRYTVRSLNNETVVLRASVDATEPHSRDESNTYTFPFEIKLNAKTGWLKTAKMTFENKSSKAIINAVIETKD